MKVNIEINLNDIWPDMEDSGYGDSAVHTIGKSVEAAIANEVKNNVWKLVREEVTKNITEQVYDHIQKNVTARVNEAIAQHLEKGMYKASITSEEIPLIELVKRFITDQKIWSSFSLQLAKVAESYAKDVQKKYDVLFATHIVMSLKDTGMLDKEKIALLFTDKK